MTLSAMLSVMGYIIEKQVTEGVYRVRTGGDWALWTRRKLRKDSVCAATGERLPKGAVAYGPLGNQQYRWMRMSAAVVESCTAK
jgi:hypothetical protein